MVTMRSGWSNGGGVSSTESMTLKIAVFTLIPSASVASAVRVNIRLRVSARTANRRSLINIPVEEGIGASPVRTQRDGGIHPRRPPGGQIARDHGNEREKNGNACERQRVVHANAE